MATNVFALTGNLLAGALSSSLFLSLRSPALFAPPSPSSLPALAQFMCWQAQATSQQQASKKTKKLWPRHKQIRRLWVGFAAAAVAAEQIKIYAPQSGHNFISLN